MGYLRVSTGGSGISTGQLTEMGQIHANDNSYVNGTIKVFHNPYSWSKVANMVIGRGTMLLLSSVIKLTVLVRVYVGICIAAEGSWI